MFVVDYCHKNLRAIEMFLRSHPAHEYLIFFLCHSLAAEFSYEKLYCGNNTNVYCKFSRAKVREYIIACPFISLAFLHYILETYNVSFEELELFSESHSFMCGHNNPIKYFFQILILI